PTARRWGHSRATPAPPGRRHGSATTAVGPSMQRFTLEFQTEGNTHVINLSPELGKRLADVRGSGLVHLFVIGSTAALTTLEYEPGLVRHDLKESLERFAPENGHYEHEATWNDDNGHSHLRAAILGPGLTIPFAS